MYPLVCFVLASSPGNGCLARRGLRRYTRFKASLPPTRHTAIFCRAASTCPDTDGILGIQNMNVNGKVCCAPTCITDEGVPQCGGRGCGRLPGGTSGCCVNPIVTAANICDVDVSVAPCLIAPGERFAQ